MLAAAGQRSGKVYVDAGIVGHWPLTPDHLVWGDVGTEIKDVSGNDNHMASVNMDASNEVAEGLLFNGIDEYAYIANPIPTALRVTGDLSISMWIRLHNIANNGPATGGWFGVDNNHLGDEYGVGVRMAYGSSGNYWLYFGWCDYSGNYNELAWLEPYISDQVPGESYSPYRHYVFTKEGFTAKIYRDGVLLDSKELVVEGIAYLDQLGTTIGYYREDEIFATKKAIRFYNKTISDDVIQALFNGVI